MANSAVAAGHQKTLDAAKEVLSSGGNAVDAAVAAYWVAFVAEPCMASAGAGGFAMVKMKDRYHHVDFFCQTPRIKKPVKDQDFYPIEVDFGDEKEIFQIGKGAAAVPGAIAGMFDLHQKWGKIPMKELASFGIRSAKEGIPLDRFQAEDFGLLKEIFKVDGTQAATFFKNGEIKKEGDFIALPDYADFLEAIIHEGKDLFYKGEIAKRIAQDFNDGGHLTRQDFESYQVIFQDPLQMEFAGSNVLTSTLPSVGGMITLALLNILEHEFQHKAKYLSYDHFTALEEACRSTFLLSKDDEELKQFLQTEVGIELKGNSIQMSGSGFKGTSHFSILDKDNNAVALTTSIGEGNGYFIPGTQMQMNNMLGEGALLPNGFHSWKENTRLRSMMCPTMVCDREGHLQFVIGSGGAGRIPYAIAQTILNKYIFSLDLADAVRSPRLYFDGQKIQVEQGFQLKEGIQNLNVWKRQSLFFGGTNCIEVSNGSTVAIGDHRRYAAAWQG